MHFFLLLEQNNLDALTRNGIANAFEGKLSARPERALKIVKNDTSVAVFFVNALSDHFCDYFLGQELKLLLVDFRVLFLSLDWLLALLFLFLLFKQFLQFLLSFLKVLLGSLAYWQAPLDTVVE